MAFIGAIVATGWKNDTSNLKKTASKTVRGYAMKKLKEMVN